MASFLNGRTVTGESLRQTLIRGAGRTGNNDALCLYKFHGCLFSQCGTLNNTFSEYHGYSSRICALRHAKKPPEGGVQFQFWLFFTVYRSNDYYFG
jgi:hypothetical protein